MNVAEGAWGAGVGPQTYGSGQHNTLACSKTWIVWLRSDVERKRLT